MSFATPAFSVRHLHQTWCRALLIRKPVFRPACLPLCALVIEAGRLHDVWDTMQMVYVDGG